MDKSISGRIYEDSSSYNVLNGDKAVCVPDNKMDRVDFG